MKRYLSRRVWKRLQKKQLRGNQNQNLPEIEPGIERLGTRASFMLCESQYQQICSVQVQVTTTNYYNTIYHLNLNEASLLPTTTTAMMMISISGTSAEAKSSSEDYQLRVPVPPLKSKLIKPSNIHSNNSNSDNPCSYYRAR